MKRGAFILGCIFIVAAGAFASRSSGDETWVGTWNGELDGQPSVRLTLADDTGELGGTVVFNIVIKQKGQARVAGSDAHVLMHTRLEGSTLSFQVVRASDSRKLQMTVTHDADGKTRLRCLNCGADTPVAELVREQ